MFEHLLHEFSPREAARNADPLPSHEAAEAASEFQGKHKDRILAALAKHGAMTPHEMSLPTGLTVVQLDRRLHELEKAGKARVQIDAAGRDVERGQPLARVWEVAVIS